MTENAQSLRSVKVATPHGNAKAAISADALHLQWTLPSANGFDKPFAASKLKQPYKKGL